MADTSSSQPLSTQQHFQNIAATYEKSTGGATRLIAKHLVNLASPINPGAKILDNACGSGIVIDELLASLDNGAIKQSITVTAVDASPAMIDLVKGKAESLWDIPADHLITKALAAEDLDGLSTETYDRSFTNFGFMFFKDPSKAAAHVYRTLKPGGTAFTTTWADLGYMRAVYAASEVIRPGQPKPKFLFGDEWFEMGHLKKLFSEAGFKSIEVSQMESRWSGKSVKDFAETIAGVISPLLRTQGWSDEDVGKLAGQMEKVSEEHEDWLEKDAKHGSVSSKMIANIAVCRK